MYKRVLLKLSGEALAGESGFGFDDDTILAVAHQIKEVVEKGVEVCVVIGGGNFWRGRTKSPINRSMSDEVGITATVMNAIYTSAVLRTIGLDTAIFTPRKSVKFTKEYELDEVKKAFGEGKVVFFAGGIGEPYFSTDTISVLRAIQIDADIILLAKNVDGIYSADPRKDNTAKKYNTLELREVVEKRLKVIDLTASNLAFDNKIPFIVFYLNEKNSIIDAVNDNSSGTKVIV